MKSEQKNKDLVAELNAIAKGQSNEQQAAQINAKVQKNKKTNFRKNKRQKNKQDKAEAIKDMLEEKVRAAKLRHKKVRNYRDDEEKAKEQEEKQKKWNLNTGYIRLFIVHHREFRN